MSNVELLNKNKHSKLKIKPRDDWASNSIAGSTMVLPAEFEEVQREYPIVLRKDPSTGQFFASAMLGLATDKNLFFSKGRWLTRYVPLTLEKGPFLIGFQNQQDKNGKVENKAVMYADIDAGCLSEEHGEPLFDEEGNRSSVLEEYADILGYINLGVEQSKVFIEALTDNELIEPMSVDMEFDDGQKLTITGIYTVSDEKLNALSPESLHDLNHQGHLKNIYLMMSSLNNMKRLIEIRNSAAEAV